MYIYSTTGEHQLHCAAAGVMFPLLISLPRCGYSALLALAALLGLSIAPLPTVTSGVITSLLGPDKLNDAFGELYLCPRLVSEITRTSHSGILTFVRGGSAFLGPPLAGYLADCHHDFSMPFILSSGSHPTS